MAAMGVSVCVVAIMLLSVGLLVDISLTVSGPGGLLLEALTVRIETESRVPDRPMDPENDEYKLPEIEDPVAQTATSAIDPEPDHEEVDEPADQRQRTSDWYALGEQVAKTTIGEYFDRKESTAKLWRLSPSVMFDPGEELILEAEEPVIADFRFVPEIHVLGLGITIGSCFIGLPFAGVPVEQRSTMITLFVCAEGS